jgi:hypothetical protein
MHHIVEEVYITTQLVRCEKKLFLYCADILANKLSPLAWVIIADFGYPV